jgi:DNA-binding response OmpR family regulator
MPAGYVRRDSGKYHSFVCLRVPNAGVSMADSPIIFVIEARQNIRTMLEMTLSSERIRVFSATSLSSALLQLRVLQPDLIIVGSDGPELFTRTAVAQIKALSNVPLLLLGCATATMTVAGVDGTLLYPLDAGDLCAKVFGSLYGG